MLLEADADTNGTGQYGYPPTPLHAAVLFARTDVVRLLLEHRAQPNDRDHMQWTPLHVAANLGLPQIAKLLVTHGADIDALNQDKKRPLDIAANKERGGNHYPYAYKGLPEPRRDKVVEFLLECYRNRGNELPQKSLGEALCWAAGEANLELVSQLLELGADVNARGKYKRTPLLLAVFEFRNRSYEDRAAKAKKKQDHVNVIRLLMAKGADPTLGDSSGSALWFARDYLKDREFTDLLTGRRQVDPDAR